MGTWTWGSAGGILLLSDRISLCLVNVSYEFRLYGCSHPGREIDGRTYGGSIGIHEVQSTNGTASVHCFLPMEYSALSTLLHTDKHGHALADFDGDGLTDMMVSVGGGLGGRKAADNGNSRGNVLLWGTPEGEGFQSTASNTSVDYALNGSFAGLLLVGGQDEARRAGLSEPMYRGRGSHWSDFDGDGWLDCLTYTDRGMFKEKITSGGLYLNNKNRTWNKAADEYTEVGLMTDATGDGHAKELLLVRGFCYPERDDTTASSPLGTRVKRFCKRRVVGTTAVYQQHSDGQLRNLERDYTDAERKRKDVGRRKIGCFDKIPARKYRSLRHSSPCFALSVESADFDGDLKADHVFLHQRRIAFYLSSTRGKRPRGRKFEEGRQDYDIELPCDSHSLRVLDLNNSGTNDILVACNNGRMLVYSQVDRRGLGSDWKLLSKTCVTGLSIAGNKEVRGLTTADVNNDGFPDILVTVKSNHYIFINQGSSNRFISLELVGKSPGNRKAVGATVELHYRPCRQCSRRAQLKEVHHHSAEASGHRDERVSFGLGATGQPIGAVVRWPGSKRQSSTVDLSGWAWRSGSTILEVGVKIYQP